jgi:enterochelin esterase-like enzyme
MLRFTLIILSLALLTACTPQVEGLATATVFECDHGGTVQSLSLDNASRGYPYSYHLYLPPCYGSDTDRVYPIIYLVPGRGSGPGAWFAAGVGELANEMILSGEVQPFIIVTTETINTDMYAKTILDELMPAIAASYRVSPERRHHAAAGGSLGGIAAYRMVLSRPEQFASAGMFGCGAISGEEEAIRKWLAALPDEASPRFFFNTGFEDASMLERAKVMIALLDEAGISHKEIFSTGQHTYAYWVSNFPAYFEWAAEDW